MKQLILLEPKFRFTTESIQSREVPLVVAYGMGVDSTAVLVRFAQLGIKPDLILFADTGGEWPETYAYLETMNTFLRANGMVEVQVVRYTPKTATYSTLEENCNQKKMLPSLAYGMKGCSLKFKRAPQDKFCNRWEPTRATWKAGRKVIKVIGYDAGRKDARRNWKIADDKKYEYWYPLRDWQWDRERCEAEIAAAGLPIPRKSSCFFCPACKAHEVDDLIKFHPDLARRIVRMEALAAPNLKSVKGLWRNSKITDYIMSVAPEIVSTAFEV